MEKKDLRRNGEVRLRHPYKAVHGRTWQDRPYKIGSTKAQPNLTISYPSYLSKEEKLPWHLWMDQTVGKDKGESWTGWHSWTRKSKRYEPANEGSHARLTSLDKFEMAFDSTCLPYPLSYENPCLFSYKVVNTLINTIKQVMSLS